MEHVALLHDRLARVAEFMPVAVWSSHMCTVTLFLFFFGLFWVRNSAAVHVELSEHCCLHAAAASEAELSASITVVAVFWWLNFFLPSTSRQHPRRSLQAGRVVGVAVGAEVWIGGDAVGTATGAAVGAT